MHVGDLTQVSRCFPTMDIPSMQSHICNILMYPNVKQSVRLCTSLQCQLDQAEVLRSLDHVIWFPCKGREGKCGRHCVFSR